MPKVAPNLAAQNDQFVAAILRELLRRDKMPPNWTFQQMRAECRSLGVTA